jgi:hypothetical protein
MKALRTHRVVLPHFNKYEPQTANEEIPVRKVYLKAVVSLAAAIGLCSVDETKAMIERLLALVDESKLMKGSLSNTVEADCSLSRFWQLHWEAKIYLLQ